MDIPPTNQASSMSAVHYVYCTYTSRAALSAAIPTTAFAAFYQQQVQQQQREAQHNGFTLGAVHDLTDDYQLLCQ